MHYSQSKDLFQLQTDLVDMKVDMAASKAIDRVLDRIDGLQHEMHDFRGDMNMRLSTLDNRVVAVETKLGMVNDSQKEIRTRVLDFLFKAGWVSLALLTGYMLTMFHTFFK